MTGDQGSGVWRSKDGRDWRIGGAAEVAWIEERTPGGLAITSAIPPAFEAYATLEQPGTGNQDPASRTADGWGRHDAALLGVLRAHAAPQPWWLGYLETGGADVVFPDAPMVELYAGWPYVLVEAGPDQAGSWRVGGWDGVLPDLIFPADRSWLFSTLWDDDWSCLGGPRALVSGLLADPELGARAREVDLSMDDATPPGHIAI